MTDLVGLEEVAALGPALVGGKAWRLGRMIQAALPVPEGFCLTTAVYREAARQTSPRLSVDLWERIQETYRPLAGGAAMVRSSANCAVMTSLTT